MSGGSMEKEREGRCGNSVLYFEVNRVCCRLGITRSTSSSPVLASYKPLMGGTIVSYNSASLEALSLFWR